MAVQFHARLSDILPLPEFLPGIVSTLGSIWSQFGFDGLEIDFDVPPVPPDLPDFSTVLTEEDSLILLDEFETDSDGSDPLTGTGTLPTGPATFSAEVARLLTLRLAALSEVKVAIPGLDGASIVLNPGGFEASLRLAPDRAVASATMALAVRFSSDHLVPMSAVPGQPGQFVRDRDAQYVQIDIASATVTLDSSGSLQLSAGAGVKLTRPAMIGETGVIIESADIRFNFDGKGDRPDGAPTDWKGILIENASIRIPSVFSGAVTVSRLGFGSGGVTGKITGTFPSGIVLGMNGEITQMGISLRENIPTEATISARVRLPFFDFPKPLDLTIILGINGDVTATLASSTGVISLDRPGFFKLDVKSISAGVEQGNVFTSVSGTLKPDAGGLAWPSLEVKDLRIDSSGNVSFAGGWVDLPKQAALSLYGFTLEITKLGFGKTDQGKRWIGFNGGIKITQGVPAGASVEGLRILWDDAGNIGVTMNGVGVDLSIPNAIELHGKVSLQEENHEFRGAVLVTLPSISMTVQGEFVAGSLPTGEKTFAVFLDLELPVGLPLGSTGLAIYGFAGLFAHNRQPDKKDNEGWYRNPDFSDGWFTRSPAGVTDVANKWRGAAGKMGLGAGLTFGTFSDNGYMFNGRVLLVLVFPGPIILLDGMANLFRKRASLLTTEPQFHSLLVIDPAKSIEVGLDAHYKYKDDGQLLDIGGSADAFFDFTNASNWHIYIGLNTPPERRIRARLFKLFDVNAFFMLSSKGLDIGSGWSFDKSWKFGPLAVWLSASMFSEASVSWHPNHFSGSISVSGSAGLRAFGFGASVTVTATVKGDVFEPFALSGNFHVGINLPWPLPDPGATVTLSWKEDMSSPPALPVPLREASIEHPKTGNTWSLQRGSSLRSDDGGGQFDFERPGNQAPSVPAEVIPPFGNDVAAPRVPADTKIGLTFTRPIDDPSLVGRTNSAQVKPEIIGNPKTAQAAYTTGYSLLAVDLQKWAPAPEATTAGFGWTTILSAGPGNVGTSSNRLLGAWVPGQEAPAAGNSQQHKLLLNATTPFDYTRDRSESWTTWLTGATPGYPCPLVDPRLSARFTQSLGTQLESPFEFAAPNFSVAWTYGGDIVENEAVVKSVLGKALGPIDRGVRLRAGVSVMPPPGSEKVFLQIGSAHSLVDTSSSFTSFEEGPFENPLVFNARLTIRSYDGAGSSRTLRENNTFVGTGQTRALQLSDWVEIEPAFSAVYLELELQVLSLAGHLDVIAVRPDGNQGSQYSLGSGAHTVRVHEPIGMVVLRRTSSTTVVASLRRFALRSAVRAAAQVSGGPRREFSETNGVITIEGPDLGQIELSLSGPEFVLLEMALPSRAQAIAQSTQDALTSLTKEDPLFEPENEYRLVVTTRRDDKAKDKTSILNHTNAFVDHAYFHVVGPPGIGMPNLPPQAEPGPTGFEDLRRYVDQTLPPSIPPEGGKLLLPRAFYRAYDPAVKFNEPYLELMYLRAKRDLTVRLFDGDNHPVLRSDGRVAIPLPSWERSRQQSVKAWISLWIGMVNQGPCRPTDLPPFTLPSVVKDQVVASSEGILLAPEKLHQVRLVPALLHETFVGAIEGLVADANGHQLERWVSQSAAGVSPRWQVQSDTIPGQTLPDGSPAQVFFVSETSGSTASLAYVGPFGAAAAHDAPESWSTFRARVTLRWTAGVVGFEFRRSSSDDLLRVTFDRSSGARQLVSLSAGSATVLAQDTTTFPEAGTDVQLIVECVADRVRVYQDDDSVEASPVFEVTGARTTPGTVGLYVEDATDSRFTEIRVDDLRADPSVAFAFDFVTSKYTNFFHHLHSFNDRIFNGAPATALTATDLSAKLGSSIAISGTGSGSPPVGLGSVQDGERRAFEALEEKSFGAAALRQPDRIEITRISASGQPLALFLRSPEPLLWDRTLLTAASTLTPLALPVPGDVALTRVSFGSTPADESVTILLRAGANLSGYRLDWRPLPNASTPNPAWTTYFQFATEDSLPDGMQVQIFASAASQGSPPAPGITQRFAASDAAHAMLHFTAPGVELRLTAPDDTATGKVVHERQFLSASAFTPLAMRAVRKLDGTAAILFLDPQSVSPAVVLTALRLQLTFTRAVGDEDLRMRQGGSETAEVVDLDVPLGA